MQDSQIVALLAAGDRQGLEAAYDVYADRLHDYARGMLRNADPEAAADVTHDTFLIAFAKAGGLRNPERLRSWLYAITRNECLRVLRTSKRHQELDTDYVAEGSDDVDVHAADLKALVHAAAEGLSPKDREVFDLGLRHDLAAAEIAAALGVSDNAAHAMMSRVRTALERSLGALLVARERSCPDLDLVLAGWDGTFDPLWRKRIARHTESCPTCAGVQKRELSPAALLAVAPLAAAPMAVRTRLVSADLDQLDALVTRAGPWRPDGFPGASPAHRRRGLLALVAVLALLFGGLGTTRALNREADAVRGVGPVATQTPGTPHSVEPTPTLTRAPRQTPTPSRAPRPTATPTRTPTQTQTPTLTVTPSPSRQPTGSPKPTREPTPAPTPTPTPTRPPVVRFTVSPGTAVVGAGQTRTFVVTISATGGPVQWTVTSGSRYLRVDGPASGTLPDGGTDEVLFTLSGRAPGGRHAANFTPSGSFTVMVEPG